MDNNIDIDIYTALGQLGVPFRTINIYPSAPPHRIVQWDSDYPEPTEEELRAAYEVGVVENAKRDVRRERDQKLVASDWTQIPDVPVDQAAWAVYRQDLRDITAQEGFPFDVTWPTEPA